MTVPMPAANLLAGGEQGNSPPNTYRELGIIIENHNTVSWLNGKGMGENKKVTFQYQH